MNIKKRIIGESIVLYDDDLEVTWSRVILAAHKLALLSAALLSMTMTMMIITMMMMVVMMMMMIMMMMMMDDGRGAPGEDPAPRS